MLAYLVLVGLIIIGLGHANWLPFYRLASHGIKTQGYVIDTNCAEHNGFRYRFSVSGKVYEATGIGGSGNPDCPALNAGNSVIVYYLSENPSTNVAGDVSERLANETVSTLLAALILPAIVTVVLYFIVRRKNQRI